MTTPSGTDIVEEVWTYVNTTPDAHPMHEHLFAMQAINREYLDAIGFQNDASGLSVISDGSWIPPTGVATPSTLLPYPLPVIRSLVATAVMGRCDSRCTSSGIRGSTAMCAGRCHGVPDLQLLISGLSGEKRCKGSGLRPLCNYSTGSHADLYHRV